MDTEARILIFNQICRTCRTVSAELRPLHMRDCQSGKENPRFDEMLMACASVKVDMTDGLPTSICHPCAYQLKKAFYFKTICEKSDYELRECLKNAKGPIIKEEEEQSDELESGDGSNEEDHFNGEEQGEILNYGRRNNNTKCKVDGDDEKNTRDYIELQGNGISLTCGTCNMVFSSVDSFKYHKFAHSASFHKCKYCSKQYMILSHLERHELVHTKRKKYMCKICKKSLFRFDHLKRHMITHLKDKPFACDKCSKGFNRTEHLMNHMQRCKGDRVHICDICNKGFARKITLEVHRDMHETENQLSSTIDSLDDIDEYYIELDADETSPVFSDLSDDENDKDGAIENMDMFEPCTEICEGSVEADNETTQENQNTNFKASVENSEEDVNSKEMLSHQENLIGEVGEELTENDYNTRENGSAISLDPADADTEDIELKPVTVPAKRGRGRPRKHPVSVTLKKPGRPRGRPRGKSHKKTKNNVEDERGDYLCPECGKNFKYMRLLEVHAKYHQGLKLHKCELCSRKFSRQSHLKRHLLCHSEVKLFSCGSCDKSFTRRDHLQKHSVVHLRTDSKRKKYAPSEKLISEKRYKCFICEKAFTTDTYRDVHMRLHTGEKHYQCKICNKTYILKSHLTEHMKFHNGHSKKYLCSECGQRFNRNDYLIIHMRRHRGEKPFKCKFCGKGFPRTTDLTVHERYHTGEKTHLCVICGRGFGRAYNLTVHMRTHTGEKPYQCSYCDAAFAQSNDLKAHIRRHTGERFPCEMCPETFLMGYLLTQHKRNVHGLNVVSNIRRLQPLDEVPENESNVSKPVIVCLPAPVVPNNFVDSKLEIQFDDKSFLE